MGSLRETKDRIASVRGTLKITSAMKLVASAKLRKSQKAIEALRPYEETLSGILCSLYHDNSGCPVEAGGKSGGDVKPSSTLVVALSSNSSLCGGFNSNVIKKAVEAASSCEGEVEVCCVGRKMSEAMKKERFRTSGDHTDLMGRTTYAKAAELAASIESRFEKGEFSKVLLVYNHFASTSRQEPVVEQFLPLRMDAGSAGVDAGEFIIEPSEEELADTLKPRVISLKLYAAILDSQAAEHAARTIAMQTATDNAEELLSDLTLEYNKGRQQKITAEILDLLGGSAQ